MFETLYSTRQQTFDLVVNLILFFRNESVHKLDQVIISYKSYKHSLVLEILH